MSTASNPISLTERVGRIPERLSARLTRLTPLAQLAAGLGAVGAVVAMIGSWIPSLWGDEAASVMSAERSLPSLFGMLTHVDAVHGTYYTGLHAWIEVFGASPFSVRFPSAVAVGFTVAAVVLIAGRLSTRRVATLAGIVCCVLPRVTYMGEEARSYAFSAAIAAWLTYLLLELLRRENPPRRLWIVYGIVLALGIYVFLYVALFAVVHAAILMRVRAHRRFVVNWIRVVAVAGVLAVPLVFLAYSERGQISYLVDQPQVTVNSIVVSLWFGTIWFAVAAWLLIGAAVISSFMGHRRRRRRSENVPWSPTRLPGLNFVATVWLVVPSVLLISTQFLYADFTARYLSYCAPAAALLIASGLDIVAKRMRVRLGSRVLVVFTVALIALATPIYLSQRGQFSKNNSDLSQISAIIGAHARPGDAVTFDESATPSKKPRLALHTYPAGFAGLDDITLRIPFTRSTTWYDRAYSIDQAYALGRFDDVTRVWLIEYATPTHVDSYGIDPLEDHGYHESPTHYRTHSGMIYLFTR